MEHYQAVEPMGFSQGTVQLVSEEMVEERQVKHWFKLLRQNGKFIDLERSSDSKKTGY